MKPQQAVDTPYSMETTRLDSQWTRIHNSATFRGVSGAGWKLLAIEAYTLLEPSASIYKQRATSAYKIIPHTILIAAFNKMSFYAPYDLYELLNQIQPTRPRRVRAPSVRPSRVVYQQPAYQYQPYQQYLSYSPDVYTLDDVLDLVSRHRSLNPSRYRNMQKEEAEAKKNAAEAAEEAAAVAQEIHKEKEEQEARAKAEAEASKQIEGEEVDLAELIKQALLGGAEPKQESEAALFHRLAPSPVHDPLQLSQPQMNSSLPFSPQVDVYDKPEFYKVVLLLPGAQKESFEIDFHPSNHELVIKGSTKKEEEDLQVSEIKFGAFERTLKFPILPKVKDEEIKAKYSNGLLEVVIPKITIKKEDVKPKRRVILEDVVDDEIKFEEGLKNRA